MCSKVDKFRPEIRLGRNARVDPQAGRIVPEQQASNSRRRHATRAGDLIEKAGLEEHTPDNALIRLAYWLGRQGERVIIVSMDINVRVKANAVGLDAEDFEHEKVNFDELYSGYLETTAPLSVIKRLYDGQVLASAPDKYHPNMFLHLTATGKSDLKVIARVFPDGTLSEINIAIDTVYGIQSRNIEQRGSNC